MFTAKPQKNRLAATLYFDEHLSHNDYYTLGQKQSGQWVGIGAEKLGLDTGVQVTREAFLRLCDNQHPETGKQLTQLHLSGRRIFFDFTCSAPKSVSILAVTMEDERIVAAHQASAAFAMKELEAFAGARVRKAGAMEDRMTGNLVGASFMHTSSRALDPQLHTHFTLFNATFDQIEARWKALQTSAMFDAIHFGTAVYRNELAKQLHRIGYETRATAHGFEIEGVEQTLIERFSKRSQQRNAAVAREETRLKRKLTNDEISHVVHKSRPRKIKDASEEAVRASQLGELGFLEKRALKKLIREAEAVSPLLRHELRASIDHAVSHAFARQSVAPEHQLLEAALVRDCGLIDLPQLKRSLSAHPELVKVGREFSTRTILEQELSMIHSVNLGLDVREAIAPEYRLADSLGADQRAALRMVLSSHDQVTGFRGLAGTGKTTALKELDAALDASGLSGVFCAPTAAATDVLRQDGFAQAMTLARLLRSGQSQGLSERSVIVLDEAGAVGTSDMVKLFTLAEKHGARVILSGDTGQHASVAQGDALRIIEEHSGYRFAALTQIRRQKTEAFREIVSLAADHKPLEAFQRLQSLGEVSEVPTEAIGPGKSLYEQAAAAYLEAASFGKAALVVSPTWAEIEIVTEHIRDHLKRQNTLAAKDEERISVFDASSWTDAQKEIAQSYEPGMQLRFVKETAQFKAGQIVQVEEVKGKQLFVSAEGRSEPVAFHPSRSSASFEVGVGREIRVAPGDWLLLQASAGDFVNGERVKVQKVSAGRITLEGGRVLPHDYRTFTHGYAVTSHSAQGKTVDQVILVASSKSFAAVSEQGFYVGISRARERARIFTDDAELLSQRICDPHTRKAAIELAGLHEALAKHGLSKPAVVAPPPKPRQAERVAPERVHRLTRSLRPDRLRPIERILQAIARAREWTLEQLFPEAQTLGIERTARPTREVRQAQGIPLPEIRQREGHNRSQGHSR